MRVVFNVSQSTTTGESLNSIQLNVGVIQDELFAIILRFRMHRFAFTADIREMYRMILIDANGAATIPSYWKLWEILGAIILARQRKKKH